MSKYTDFAFATAHADTIGHERTMPSRLLDRYNVKDYGAKGEVGLVGFAAAHDDTASIQAAINDTFASGIIFFPPGIYKITSPIKSASNAGAPSRHRMLIFQGCGSNIASGSGSILQANMSDYIYYSPDYPTFVAARSALVFDGLGFNNTAAGVAPTSTESASNPTAPGNAGGCMNIQTDAFLDVRNCEFKVNKGICFFMYGQNSRISHSIFRGGFTGGGGMGDSFGMLNMETVEHCKFYNLGTAYVNAANNGLAIAKNLDFFHCGMCMELGNFPIDWWDTNLHHITAAGNAPVKASYFSSIRMRSFAFYGLHISNMAFCVLDNLTIDSDGAIGTPTSGIQAASFDVFRGGKISGTYSVAALDCGIGQGNDFYNYDVTCSGPGVAYRPTVSPGSTGYPNFFTNCPFDTSQSFNSLPSNPPWKFRYVIINDSQDLAWDSGTSKSNVGKPVTFFGTNKVVAFHNGSTWCIAG